MEFPTYEEADSYIKDIEISTTSKLIVYKKSKGIKQTRVASRDLTKILWEENKGDLPIPYKGVPFVVLGKEERECHHGPKRSKGKCTKNEETTNNLVTVQRSKKMDCQYRIKMRFVVYFPQYKISGVDSDCKRRKLSRQLKEAFSDRTVQKYSAYLKECGQHEGHLTGELAGYGQPVDEVVRKKVRSLVLDDGLRDIGVIQTQIQLFSRSKFPSAISSNKRFFPTSQDIRNHVFLALNKTRYSQNDQTNVMELIQSWREQFTSDYFFYRPASSEEEEECVQSFLFIHQSAFQQRLLSKYGSECILVDITHKTCRFKLPLMFLCVLSNVGYQVVAIAILGTETRKNIKEALDIVKEHNKDWKPKSAMCDMDWREIGAVEDVFDGIQVYICDFHREQAWDRWFNKRDNGAHTYKKEATEILRRIARSKTEIDFIASHSELRQHKLYKTNIRFKTWIERCWIADKKRWVHCFRSSLMNFRVNTTNGVESQNKVLKHKYLKRRGASKTLSDLVTILVQQFVPDSRQRYIRENVISMDLHRQYSRTVPLFIRNRPKWFVSHCMTRLNDVVKSTHNVQGYQINGESNHYIVKTDVPSCSCPDFTKYNLPCKHFLHVITHYPSEGWDFLPAYYTSLPIFCLDMECNQCNDRTPNNTESAAVVTDPAENHSSETESSAEVTDIPEIHKRDSPNKCAETSIRRNMCELLQDLQNNTYLLEERALVKVLPHIKKANEIAKSLLPKGLTATTVPESGRHVASTTKRKSKGGKCKSSDRKRNVPSDVKPRSSNTIEKGKSSDRKRNVPSDVKPRSSKTIEKDNTATGAPDREHCNHEKETLPSLPQFPWKSKPNVEKEIDLIWSNEELDKTYGRINGYCIDSQSVRYIKHTLSDEVMDAFLHLLVKKYESKDLLHISCITMTMICDGNTTAHRWLQCEKPLLSYDYILGGYNQGGNHWTLMIISPKEGIIRNLNPLGSQRKQERTIIKNWYAFLKSRPDVQDNSPATWKTQSPKHCKQPDGESCGIYVLKFAENFLAGRSFVFSWSANDIKNARKTLAMYLLSTIWSSRRTLPVAVECASENHGYSLRTNKSNKRRSSPVCLKPKRKKLE